MGCLKTRKPVDQGVWIGLGHPVEPLRVTRAEGHRREDRTASAAVEKDHGEPVSRPILSPQGGKGRVRSRSELREQLESCVEASGSRDHQAAGASRHGHHQPGVCLCRGCRAMFGKDDRDAEEETDRDGPERMPGEGRPHRPPAVLIVSHEVIVDAVPGRPSKMRDHSRSPS